MEKQHVSNNHKKAGVVTLLSDKIDFKTKECYQRFKKSLNNDKRVSPSGRHSSYNHTCTKIQEAKIDRNEGKNAQLNNRVGDFNTPLTTMDRTTNQKIKKEREDLNNTRNLTGIYVILHPTTQEYTFSTRVHGTFSRRDLMLGHKTK